MAWTDERVELLTKLHADGLSSSQIGGRLGVTRNSVISKIHRLGLANGRLPLLRKKMTGMVRLHRSDLATINGRRKRMGLGPHASIEDHYAEQGRIKAEFDALQFAPEVEVPPAERKSILTRDKDGKLCANDALTNSSCRWPIGDPQSPDFHFCNGVATPGLPYCKRHCARAYAPPLPRPQKVNMAKWGGARDLMEAVREFDTVGE